MATPTNITTIGMRVAKEGFDKACTETKIVMQSLAPESSGKARGKGSCSTGATKKSIRIFREGDFKAFIGPTTPYAYYAENGRYEIPRDGGELDHYMVWDGKYATIFAKSVAGMQGWHFVKETSKLIKKKYGV